MRDENVFAYRSFNPELETVRRFTEFGVDWVCIFPSNILNSIGLPYSVYGPTWLGLGQYDFEPFDREVRELLAVNPTVNIICMVDLNSPPWLMRRLSIADSFRELGRTAGCEQWREATRDYMHAFLRHAEANYAANIHAYMLSCGGTSEWQERSFGDESSSRRAAFRKWAIERCLPDPVDIPPASVRDHVSHDLLRDPEADAAALAYWEFCNWQIGDAILYFAQAAQKIIDHRAELGAFYGYILTFGQNRLVSEGHLDYERVFASPDIDFFVAPASYVHREMGGTSPFLVPVGSVKHRGKAFLQELDHRTHTSKRPADWYTAAFNKWSTEQETIVGLRREFAFCLVEDVSLWWFDMWGGFYEGQNVLEAMARMKCIWEEAKNKDDGPVAQVAVIVDPVSARYIDQTSPRANAFTWKLCQAMARIGAPHRVFSWGDVEDLDFSAYRLVIFPNLFVMNGERQRLLADKVLCDERTVLWLYRPGVIADGRYDENAMQALTGIGIDALQITARDMRGWHSVVSPTPEIAPCELRTVARAAGVHIYCDTDEPLYASRRYIALHSAEGGARRIALSRTYRTVTEVFTGRVAGRNTDVIETELATPDTVLYELDD